MKKPKPFLIDLDAMTQEQLNRAMANPGNCRYTGPCALGAMMPAELIERISITKTSEGIRFDSLPISRLVQDGFVSFPESILNQQDRARRVQNAFDSLRPGEEGCELVNANGLETLQLLLPHLVVPKEIT